MGGTNHSLNGMIIQAGAQEGILNPPGVGWWCWYHTADTSVSSHSQPFPPGMFVQNPCKKMGYSTNLDWWVYRISERSTVWVWYIYLPSTTKIIQILVRIPFPWFLSGQFLSLGTKINEPLATFWKTNTLGITASRSHFLDHKIRSLWLIISLSHCMFIWIYIYIHIYISPLLKTFVSSEQHVGKKGC